MDLRNVNSIYFIGVGGIGMSALARYFKAQGKQVAGYDKTATALTAQLQQEGIDIHFDENLELILKDPDLIVYTPAIPKEHLELQHYRESGFPLMKRSELLGRVTENTYCIAVAGTHGKTTVTSIIAHILKHSGIDCTAFIGGISSNYNSNFLMADSGNITVVEADEYDRSFLQLHPDIAIITSMDADHLDIYSEPALMQQSFNEFANQVKENGQLMVHAGLNIERTHLTYALDEIAEFHTGNITVDQGSYAFDFVSGSGVIEGIRFGLPGRHNIENAVAAIAVARKLGAADKSIKEALECYEGVKRRFEYIIRSQELVFIDDYAHHPEELRVCIEAVREMYPGRKITGVFQPHLYSRTRDFAKGFGESLSQLDEVVLLPVYPAREKPIDGVESEMLLPFISSENKTICQKAELVNELMNRDLDVLLTLGAGDIDACVEPIKNALTE